MMTYIGVLVSVTPSKNCLKVLKQHRNGSDAMFTHR